MARGKTGGRRKGGSDQPIATLMTAEEVTARLDVKAETLYAYVSRGLVRTSPGPDARRRLYVREDVERLYARSRARRGHGAAAAGALRWGEPVLESAITEIDGQELRYRGVSARELAERRIGFEAVAEFLWTGVLPGAPVSWEAPPPGLLGGEGAHGRWLAALRDASLATSHAGHRPPLTADLMAYGVASFALHERPLLDAGDESLLDVTLARARRLIGFLAGRTAQPAPRRGSKAPPSPSVAAALLRSLGGRQDRTLAAEEQAVRAVDLALVQSADHELNASTFAARVAASTGADLSACMLAALGTLSGPRHGGACNEVEAFLASLPSGPKLAVALRSLVQAGKPLPGFGHQLYPGGDPRAPPLLAAATELAGGTAAQRKIRELSTAVEELTGVKPSIDLGLVAVAQALGLGGGGALALFALGRTAGWTAHVIEQRQQGFLLRPRAKYVGRRAGPS